MLPRVLTVDSFVELSRYLREADPEHLTNPQQRRYRNRPSRLNLLPVPSRESERNHVLLAVAVLSAKCLDPLPEGLEEFLLIRHLLANTLTRAESPRAE